MVVVAEDMKEADAGTVALIQTTRLVVVLYTVPVLAAIFARSSGANSAETQVAAPGALAQAATVSAWPDFLGWLLLPVVLLSVWGLKRLRVPAGEFLGPALFVGTLSALGCPWPGVPSLLLAAAQLCIGIFIGRRVDPRRVLANRRLAPLSLLMAAVLVFLTACLAWVLSKGTGDSIVTWFLALAPGGLGEVAATALVLDADVAKVTAYQMFRLFFILLVSPPLLKRAIRKGGKRRGQGTGRFEHGA